MVLNTSQIILLAHRRATLRRTTPQRCDERSPTRSRDFIWDDEGNPVAMIEGSTITHLHADHLGTPRRGTDAAGTVTWAWDGEAFGASAPSIAAVDVPLRFPGQILDADTGLVFNGWRTYVPAWGRYLESDPIGLAGGINSYTYARGNPLFYVDPTGEIGLPGLAIGVGVELGLQAINNYRSGCSLLALNNYDWYAVGISAIVSSISPGWLSVSRNTTTSARAIASLAGQLSHARTINRASKLAGRIQSHTSSIAADVITQGAFQGSKYIANHLTSASSYNGCACSK